MIILRNSYFLKEEKNYNQQTRNHIIIQKVSTVIKLGREGGISIFSCF